MRRLRLKQAAHGVTDAAGRNPPTSLRSTPTFRRPDLRRDSYGSTAELRKYSSYDKAMHEMFGGLGVGVIRSTLQKGHEASLTGIEATQGESKNGRGSRAGSNIMLDVEKEDNWDEEVTAVGSESGESGSHYSDDADTAAYLHLFGYLVPLQSLSGEDVDYMALRMGTGNTDSREAANNMLEASLLHNANS